MAYAMAWCLYYPEPSRLRSAPGVPEPHLPVHFPTPASMGSSRTFRDFHIHTMFKEDPSSFRMTGSRCHGQRCLVYVESYRIYILPALDDIV